MCGFLARFIFALTDGRAVDVCGFATAADTVLGPDCRYLLLTVKGRAKFLRQNASKTGGVLAFTAVVAETRCVLFRF